MNFSNEAKNIMQIANSNFVQAKYICDEHPIYYDKSKMWWIWNFEEFKYQLTDETNILNMIRECLSDDAIKSSNLRSNLITALQMEGRKRQPLDFKNTWIQFKNKIYDYETGEILEANHKYFNTNPIPFNVGDSLDTPIIDKLFTDWVGEKDVITLKEICAFSLVQEYFLHRIVCLTGSGCNGKGVFLRFIQKLLGKDNCTSTELDLLIKNTFGTSSLYKKLLCVMGETDFGVLTTTGRLKSLSGQDSIQAQFKGKDQFEYFNYAKLFIATNTIPATTDKTDGFYRRWLIVDFPFKFKEGSDPLKLIPEIEYSNFLRQLFPMIISLKKRGMFSNDGDIEHRKQRYEAKSNPFPKFIEENYIKSGINSQVDVYEMFNLFQIYLDKRGLRKITYNEFKSLCVSENFEIEEERIYKEVYDKEQHKFINKQVRVKYIHSLELKIINSNNKTNKTEKTEINSQGAIESRPQLKSLSCLSVLNYQDLIYQYIKKDTKKEYFISDFVEIIESNDKIKEILSIMVQKGDLMETCNNGWIIP
jgi:P4 family phage/plasmid primase-like protien